MNHEIGGLVIFFTWAIFFILFIRCFVIFLCLLILGTAIGFFYNIIESQTKRIDYLDNR